MTSRTNRNFDVIIIGGGHNGLVAAAYLARAGKRVCVLERRHVLGGCASTENLWPGFRVSTAAYVLSLLLPEIQNDLRLSHYGLKILPRNPSSFTPLIEGRYLLLGQNGRENYHEIAKFSQRDAEEYPRYNARLERIAELVESLLDAPAADLLPVPSEIRKPSLGKRFRDTSRLVELYQALASLGEDLPLGLELLTGAARPFLERTFEAEVLRATLATDAIIGGFSSLSAPGTAYVLLHHMMGTAGGGRGVWGYVAGGMGRLADALESACVDLHVEVVREAEVKRILVEENQVRGVALTNGSMYEANVVASGVDAHHTFEIFLDAHELPESFRTAVSHIDYSSASLKINLALSEPPQFTCLPCAGVGPHHSGTMHIGPTLDYLERAFDDAKWGLPSREPVLEITMPSALDSSLAPAGKHVLGMFVQYAPYRLAQGDWDGIKEEFADRCIATLARYAPNVPNAILHRQVLSPLDLERTYRLTGGNIMQGAMTPNQLYFQRPVFGWCDHRTPVRGLYLCGAASHPGGGVMGAPGRNAAQEILRDHP